MSPTTDTVPRVGWSSPPRMPSSVDFPQPDGPTMARISPWRMVKLTSSRTDSDPYWWLMPAATSSKAIRSNPRGVEHDLADTAASRHDLVRTDGLRERKDPIDDHLEAALGRRLKAHRYVAMRLAGRADDGDLVVVEVID